ncbi:MAG: methylated-DNA--[protein]-cysteine S-methyltransferase [Erysipelotrichaceae bacterium]|nr:methylated-DNA--[protein]-cysteine S-methyltransferase [Erysipelotrichaceae bacterium]
MLFCKKMNSELGELTLVASEKGLVGLWIEGQKYYLGKVREEIVMQDTDILNQAQTWLKRYFSGEKPEISELPLDVRGTDFSAMVWELLCEIPYGFTCTYKHLADTVGRKTGKKMSAQAIGQAVGHNPVSIIIPCHRVVGANGSLTGYAGGIDKKVWLLKHEGAYRTEFFVPVSQRK